MFEIKYKIIIIDYEEDLQGTEGFFQFKCNNNFYGDFYVSELEKIMDKVSIYNWFERYLIILSELQNKDYLVLSDTESFNIWIEFELTNDKLLISLVEADKPNGSMDIETELINCCNRIWTEKVDYLQFKDEIQKQAKQYVKSLKELNLNCRDCKSIRNLEELINLHIQI